MSNIIVCKLPLQKKQKVFEKIDPLLFSLKLRIEEEIKNGTPKYELLDSENMLNSVYSYYENDSHMYFAGNYFWIKELEEFSPIEKRDIDAYGIDGLSFDMKDFINRKLYSL